MNAPREQEEEQLERELHPDVEQLHRVTRPLILEAISWWRSLAPELDTFQHLKAPTRAVADYLRPI